MTVHILRGLPGIGKSTYARTIAQENTRIVSADDYFRRHGQYQFDRSKLTQAHTNCLRRFVQKIEDGFDLIVDNTNIRAWEFSPYVAIGLLYRRPIIVTKLITRSWGSDTARRLAARCQHGVPADKISKMHRAWEAVPEGLLRSVTTKTITLEI